MTEVKRAEAVAALIVGQGSHQESFLGVSHLGSKRISGRIGSGLQVSIPTETMNEGETHLDALGRMLRVEELWVEGVSDRHLSAGVHLNSTRLITPQSDAILHTYVYRASRDTHVRILEEEIAEVGWVDMDTVLGAPEDSWWVRPSVFESIADFLGWDFDAHNYSPFDWTDQALYHPIHDGIYGLLDAGLSERQALSQLGLLGSDQPRPWEFVRLLARHQHPSGGEQLAGAFPASPQLHQTHSVLQAY